MSATSRRRESSLSGSMARTLQAYPEVAKKLPEPSETWKASDHDIRGSTLVRLHRTGVVRKAGREDGANGTYYWRTADGVHEWVDSHLDDDNRGTTPCGATGVVNLGNGWFTCNDNECTQWACLFDEATAREVVSA